jgi:predicted RNA-binding protein with PIN domain
VIERDDDFRARVAAVADEDEVGRAGWLWLTRPDGWEAELDELEASTAALAADEHEARIERSAAKRLAAAEAATAKAESAAAARAAELSEVRPALVAEREQRSAAEARVDELERAVADLTEARSEAVRQLKRAEARLVERAAEVKALKARLKEFPQATAERSEDGGDEAARAGGQVPVPVEPLRPEAALAAPPVVAASPAPAPSPAPGAGASAELVAELARTAEGAALLAEGLAALARRLGAGTAADDLGIAGGTGVGADSLDTAAGQAAAGAAGGIGAVRPGEAGSAVGRRAPLALPGGVFDDSVEAADHLLRVPGIVLVVDGYNVSMTGWPDLNAGDQRRRLVAALDDLAARTSTLTDVVFDGAEADPGWVASTGRRMVRVRFSSPDVEADDVVIDIVGRLPAATPVVVASSDKRVRDGARRAGANLLHARQLVALLRR